MISDCDYGSGAPMARDEAVAEVVLQKSSLSVSSLHGEIIVWFL